MSRVNDLWNQYGDHIARGNLGRSNTKRLLKCFGEKVGSKTADKLISKVRLYGGPTTPSPVAMTDGGNGGRSYVDQIERGLDPTEPPSDVGGNASLSSERKNDGTLTVTYEGDIPVKTYAGEPPTTDDLLRMMQIDPDQWEVGAIKIKQNQAPMKDSDCNPYVVRYFQAGLTCLPRKIERKPPVVLPEIRRQERAVAPVAERCLVIPDAQVGFRWDRGYTHLRPMHDRLAMDAVWQIAERGDFDTIFLLGDMLDLAPWSTKYARHPSVDQTTQASVSEFAWWLTRLRSAAPTARIVYLEGNHEKRIRSLLEERAPELIGVKLPSGEPAVSVKTWLGMDRLDIEYVAPYGERAYWHDVMVTHGEIVKRGGGATAAAMLREYTTTAFQGHIHRVEHGMRTFYEDPNNPRFIDALSPGCLCNLRGDSPPATNRHQDWQCGYGLAQWDDGIKRSFSSVEAIVNGVTVFDSQIVRGEDVSQQIADDLGIPQIAGLK